jgi:catechol 2,3-dioxygenase-like lactoylglutathione lyase family enzyme
VLTDFYMININVQDLDRSVEFYTRLGFVKVLEFGVDEPEVGEMFGLDDFGGLRFAWMKLEGARKGAPVLDLVEFSRLKVEAWNGNPRTRSGMARLSFRVDDIDAEYEYLRELGVEFVVPLRRRIGPGGEPLAVMWFLDPDRTVVEVLQVSAKQSEQHG